MSQLDLFLTSRRLTCIKPERNKRLFYALSVQRTLLGEWRSCRLR